MYIKTEVHDEKKHVKLSKSEWIQLEQLLRSGSMKARTYKRITGLLELDKGKTYLEVAQIVGLSNVTLSSLAKRFKSESFDCLYDNSRPGRPVVLTKEVTDKVVLLACSQPPEGYGQWSLRLLADRTVELGYCDNISHTQVSKILKKNRLNLT